MIGNAVDRSKHSGRNKITICGTDIPVDPNKTYTVFEEEITGKKLLKMKFDYITYFVDMLVFRNHVVNFESVPLLFHEAIYNDIKEQGELSSFWQKDNYDLKSLLKRFQHKENAKAENDVNNNERVDMTRPVIRKNKSQVVQKLMKELGLSRQVARKYVNQIEEKTDTKIFNFTVGEIYDSLLEMKGLK